MTFEDVDQKRLDFAVKCGATHTVLIGRAEKEEDVVPRIVEATGGMPDRTIECSGGTVLCQPGCSCKYLS